MTIIRHLSGEEAVLDELVNVDGLDQLTASQILWAPHLLEEDVPDPGPAAALPDQVRWARFRGRQIVREGLADVLKWLGIESDPMEIYRRAKGETR